MSASMPLPAELTPAPLDDDALAAEIDGEHQSAEVFGDTDRKPWRITDDGAAEWCGRKRSAVAARIEEVRVRAEEWHAQIDAWAETEYLRLPSVTVTSRGSDQPKAVVVDDETVCSWLRGRALDAYYSVKYSPKRRELADDIEVKRVPGMTGAPGSEADPDYFVALLDGEEVPGVEVQEPSVSFTVKSTGGA